MSKPNMNVESLSVMHQTVRESVSRFDETLMTLLTQGNMFVLALLSSPLLADVKHPLGNLIITVAGTLFAFLLWRANSLYLNLMRESVRVAKEIESEIFGSSNPGLKLTHRLDEIPWAAGQKITPSLLYVALPFCVFLGGCVLTLMRLWPLLPN